MEGLHVINKPKLVYNQQGKGERGGEEDRKEREEREGRGRRGRGERERCTCTYMYPNITRR